MAEKRRYNGGANKLTLKGNLDPTSLNITTNEVPVGWDDPLDPARDALPFWLVINRGKANEEKIDAESIAPDGIGGGTIVVRGLIPGGGNGRGADGTNPQTHAQGSILEMIWTAEDAQDSNDHINSVSAHGLPTGAAFVGTSGPQIITDKTIHADALDVKRADGTFHSPLFGEAGEKLSKPVITDPISTVPPLTVGAAHTLDLADQSCILIAPAGATVTIPDDTVLLPVGTVIGCTGPGKVHFVGAAGVTVDTGNGAYSIGANAMVFMWKKGPNLWQLIGDLTNKTV